MSIELLSVLFVVVFIASCWLACRWLSRPGAGGGDVRVCAVRLPGLTLSSAAVFTLMALRPRVRAAIHLHGIILERAGVADTSSAPSRSGRGVPAVWRSR